ncbi:hypothetical protein ACFLW2_01230 [Chloroflexota bacterium]
MVDQCPGAVNIRMPRLEVKDCPKCGEEIEIFSNEASTKCSECGLMIYNDLLSCVQWCEYAKECVGEETYERLMQQLSEENKDGE